MCSVTIVLIVVSTPVRFPRHTTSVTALQRGGFIKLVRLYLLLRKISAIFLVNVTTCSLQSLEGEIDAAPGLRGVHEKDGEPHERGGGKPTETGTFEGLRQFGGGLEK
jgi:hypothetical protein